MICRIPSKYILETVVTLVDLNRVPPQEPSYHGNLAGNKSGRESVYLSLKPLVQIRHLEGLVHHKQYEWLDVHPLKLGKTLRLWTLRLKTRYDIKI